MDRRTFIITGTSSAAILLAGNEAVFAQDATPPDLSSFPRDKTVIIQNPDGPARNPGWFNIWVSGGGRSHGLHQLIMDTLWFVDPDAGIEGKSEDAIYNSLASELWQYNDDFTEMTVKLRQGILWSDGVEFTADDLVYTVEKQKTTPGMLWSGVFSAQVETVTAPDPYTVVFKLKAPNARFHATFLVRWDAAWVMPKHVFEKVEDVMTFAFDSPVSLGPYTLHSYDPNGTWFVWQKRPDWDKTTLALVGEPQPEFVIYRNGMTYDNRFIEMRNGNLDMIHDLTPESAFAIVKQDSNVHGWFKGFPYAHPDPTLPMIIFNHQKEKFQDRRVRWALTLMLDIKAISMASYRGAATLTAISVPLTGTHARDYHEPLQQYLTDFELDTGTRKIKPYDPTIGQQIADMIRPQYGDDVPTDPDAIKKSFGYGWWKQDAAAAAELLTSAGLTKSGNQWILPSGEPFKFSILVPAEGTMNRLGVIAAQFWSQNGIEVTAEVAPDRWPRQAAGDYEANVAWAVETYGGHPDLAFFLDSYHSEYVSEPGKAQTPRNWMRWENPELDSIIEQIRHVDFNDPKSLELGHAFVKLHLQEMPNIPIMSYNLFSVQSERYWTGWPTFDNPYANPVTNWANGKYILTQIRPVAS